MHAETDTQSASLAARYGANAPPAAGPWNPTLDLLLAHRSVRAYLPDALPEGTLGTLIAAAQSAATSSNLQTWSVIEVTDPEARRKLSAVAANQKHIMECPLFLVWLADISRNRRVGEQEGVDIAVLPYFETFLVAALDAALAAQNAVVAAESLGLSTLYIGALRNDMKQVGEILGLPPGVAGVFGLCVGYADAARLPEVKPRLPQDVVLHQGRYGTEGEAARRAAYDETLAAFSARNETARSTWTDRIFARMTKLAHMAGRDKMRDALAALGFELR